MKSHTCMLLSAFWMASLLSAPFTASSQVITGTSSCPHVNKAPFISIVNPIAGKSYNAGSDINFDVTASDQDGSIMKVEFFTNGNRISIDSAAPYRFTGVEVEAGDYVLTAKATDNSGGSTVSDTVRITVDGCAGSGSILAEGYTNISGASIAELTSNPAFPNHPSVTASLPQFEYGNDIGDGYGVRVRGYICAPVTGNYTFYISGDDQVELWLSKDCNPANKILLANILSWTNPKQYDKFSSQKSVPVRLIKGARYYIETLHKEYHSYDHLSVAWTLPGGVFESPIKGSHLSPWAGFATTRGRSSDFGIAMRESTIENNAAEKLSATAFPNPFQNYITLNTKSNNAKPISAIIVDITGRVMEEKLNIPANGSLQLGNKLPSGIYFLEITQDENKERLKIMKQ